MENQTNQPEGMKRVYYGEVISQCIHGRFGAASTEFVSRAFKGDHIYLFMFGVISLHTYKCIIYTYMGVGMSFVDLGVWGSNFATANFDFDDLNAYGNF